ncbi:hypothetical protein LTS18_015050, partial [Coniosporium uncinatum]
MRKKSQRFLFGDTVLIEADMFSQVILEDLAPRDDQEGQPRKVILVGRGLHNDIRRLAALGVFPLEMPNVAAILDTLSIASAVMPTETGRIGYSLQNLLSLLCPD